MFVQIKIQGVRVGPKKVVELLRRSIWKTIFKNLLEKPFGQKKFYLCGSILWWCKFKFVQIMMEPHLGLILLFFYLKRTLNVTCIIYGITFMQDREIVLILSCSHYGSWRILGSHMWLIV